MSQHSMKLLPAFPYVSWEADARILLCRRVSDGVLLRGGMVGMLPEEEAALRACLGIQAERSQERIVARFDAELRHCYVSPSIERFAGISPAAFLGRTNEELGMPPWLIRLWNEQLRGAFRRGEPRDMDFQLLLPGEGGRARPVRFHSRLMPELNGQGDVCSVLSVAEVVPGPRPHARSGSSKPVESTEEASSSERAPSGGGGGRRRRQALTADERLAWMKRATRTLIAHQDKRALLQSLESLALPLLGELGGVDLLQDQGLTRMALFPASASDEQGPWTRPFPFLTRVLHSANPQLLAGPAELVQQAVAEDSEHLRRLREAGLRSFIAVPLMRGTQAFGCLWFASTDPSLELGAEELALAEQLGLLASPAVEAARLRRVEREIRERETQLVRKTEALRRVASALEEALLPAQVADAVMREVKAALSARAAVVYRLGEDGTAVELLQASGYEASITRSYARIPLTMASPVTRAAREREGIWVESAEAFRREYPGLAARRVDLEDGAWGALPLLVESRVLGVLAMSFDTTRAFTEEERAFALALAQLCAQALARGQLYHQLQTQIGDFQTLLNVLPVGIGISRDRECHHIEQNAALARMLAAPLEQNVSVTAPEAERLPGLRAFHGNRQLEPEELPVQRAAATGRPLFDFEMDIEVAGQPRRTVVSFAAPLLDKERRPRGAVAAFLDITERKRCEDAQRFLSRSSAVLSASLEPERTFQALTGLCVPMLGSLALLYESREDGALGLRACAHERPELARALTEAAREGRLLGEPLVRRVLESGQPLLCPDMPGELGAAQLEPRGLLERLALGSLMVLPLQGRGRTQRVLVCGVSAEGAGDFRLARDFAERAALAVDNALLYQEAREATALRDQFLAVAGHELRTPLTALRLVLESLSRREPTEEPARRVQRIAQCQRQGARLERLVDDLLDVGRLASGRLTLVLEELDLAAVVEEVIARMALPAERAGCSISSQLQGPSLGRWDRMRLEQVVTNLLGNAMKYGAGKPIEVCVSAGPEEAVLRVTDHGIGIAAEDHARIFQRFERAVLERHYGGLGLGLWITRELVHRMGGRIDVRSAPGQGATFTVHLPRQAAASASGAEVRALSERS